MKKIFSAFICLILSFAMLTACGKAKYEASIEAPAAMEAPAESDWGYSNETVFDEEASGASASSDVAGSYGLKIIYSADLSIQSTEYDNGVAAIKQAIEQCKGYISNSNEYSYNSGDRSMNMTVRIPADNYRAFLEIAGTAGKVTNKSEYTDDVTSQYVDIEARLNSLTTQEKRLLELLEKAESIDDILSLESQLSDVRYQIESYTSQIKTFDNLIALSTVNIYFYEVSLSSAEPETFGDRVVSAIAGSLESVVEFLKALVIGIIYALPFVIIIGIIVFIIIKVVRKAKTKKQNKNDNPISDESDSTDKK